MMVAGAALVLAAAGAHAQQAPARILLAANDFAAQASNAHDTTPRRSLEWDPRKGRWGLKLGVEQHTDRDVQWKDIQPGVFYRLTPRLHIGGAVSLAPDEIENQRLGDPQLPAPRVRLETTFKF
ncbi:MAG: NtrZ family periplasmic regulatory protein [Caulobacteraceae bacterium]